MSRKLEKSDLQRYESSAVIEHLASNYVLGLLNVRVRNRVDNLRADIDFRALDKRIGFWEQKLSPLNNTAPEISPLPETWQKILVRLGLEQEQTTTSNAGNSKPARLFSFSQFAGVFSLIICVVLGFSLLQKTDSMGPLSYVAVLEDDKQVPQVVAATYGESKQLVLDIIDLPAIETEQSYELWVVSKTDNQARSLGEIPKGLANFDRQLTEAEWRLIADSSILAISVEDEGGSATGEPSDMIVSKGLCIRLSDKEESS